MKTLIPKKLILYCSLSVLFFSCKKSNELSPTVMNGTPVVTPNSFLSGTNYDKLIIQIQSVNGLQPNASSVDNLKTFLQQRLNKPNGIEVTYSTITSPGKTIYTIGDIRSIEQISRSVSTSSKTLTAYILFIDGDYSENSGSLKTLGLTYSSSSMVIFEKTIRDLSGGIGQPSVASVETSVSEHEFGHILGLVNNGTVMVTGHQDEPHGKHCSNTNCLMYYATETSDFINNIIGNNVPVLDNNCINDLEANGGK